MIWTPGKDATLRGLLASGASLDRIAAVLRTSPRTIDARIDRLGLRHVRTMEPAS